MTPLPQAPAWRDLADGPAALFLDVDGTLLEFELHPDLVRATKELLDLLRSVTAHLDGALALISGRPLADLDRVFAPWQPCAAGGHGAEVRGPSGVRRHQIDPAVVSRLRLQTTEAAGQLPGVWIEDKGYGFALHYRGHPEQEAAVVALAADVASRSEGILKVQPGMLVQELRPAAFDKGQAVAELMEHEPFAGRRPIVVGDDRTDEFAFEAANARGGVSILVGPRGDTVATYRIDDPAAVRTWLAAITEEATR